MSEQQPFEGPPLGFFELDGAGTVLYFKPEGGDGGPLAPRSEQVVGRNFFRDIAAVRLCSDLQEQIKRFGRGHQPTHNFTHTFDPDGPKVKVLLARIREQTPEGGADSVFIHIRQA